MSDYDLRPGGSLKLKRGVDEGGIVKKRKKLKKSKSKQENEDDRAEKLLREDDLKDGSPAGSGRASPAIQSSDRKTEAEKRFEQVQRKRLKDRVAKMANMTHKERVNDFNSKLESLSEHHDIPKVGPG